MTCSTADFTLVRHKIKLYCDVQEAATAYLTALHLPVYMTSLLLLLMKKEYLRFFGGWGCRELALGKKSLGAGFGNISKFVINTTFIIT